MRWPQQKVIPALFSSKPSTPAQFGCEFTPASPRQFHFMQLCLLSRWEARLSLICDVQRTDSSTVLSIIQRSICPVPRVEVLWVSPNHAFEGARE